MAERKSTFSGKYVGLLSHHRDSEKALHLYFSESAPEYRSRFLGYRTNEVVDELNARLDELEMTSTLTLLAAIEAAFKIDYLQRCWGKKRGALSVEFRELYKKKGDRASLENEILDVWKNGPAGSATLIGHLRGAFKFRHWLAHGRYWKPKLGGTFDFLAMYSLAQGVLQSFPLVDAGS